MPPYLIDLVSKGRGCCLQLITAMSQHEATAEGKWQPPCFSQAHCKPKDTMAGRKPRKRFPQDPGQAVLTQTQHHLRMEPGGQRGWGQCCRVQNAMQDAVTGPDCYRTAYTSIMACIILCQQLERLGSRGSCRVSEPGCCRDEPCTCTQTNIYFIYLLVDVHPVQPGWSCWWSLHVCRHSVHFCCVYVCIYVVYVHSLCAFAGGYIFRLVAGWWGMEPQQPFLSGSKIMLSTISSSTAQNSQGRRDHFLRVNSLESYSQTSTWNKWWCYKKNIKNGVKNLIWNLRSVTPHSHIV